MALMTGSQGIPANDMPRDFVHADALLADVVVDLRYTTPRNFIGQPIDGYEKARLILTRRAAMAVQAVQAELREAGFGLLVFDAYRPQRAVDQFVRWCADTGDTRNKLEYYPDVDKSQLIPLGYIASHSSHSRGSTLDVTLIDFDSGEELDMGSQFDFFGPQSWSDYADLSRVQLSNRARLRQVMQKHGFEPYQQEWWHFTLCDEPFPDRYFNFPVR